MKPRMACAWVLSILLIVAWIYPAKAAHADYGNAAHVLTAGLPTNQHDVLATYSNADWVPVEKPAGEYNTFDIELERKYHYSEIEDILLYCVNRSPLTKLYKIGQSVDGRNLYAYEIGNAEANIIYVAGVHAREVFNPLLMLKMTSSFLNDYAWGKPEVAQILQKVRFVILPLANPDGFESTWWGKESIRNRDLFMAEGGSGADKGNANGVDLNRSFPSYTAGLLQTGKNLNPRYSSAPAAGEYAGTFLGAEPETRAMMAFFYKYIPNSRYYADFHSAGRILYSGKPHLSNTLNERMRAAAQKTANALKYTLMPLAAEETADGSDGSTTDFVAELLQGYAFNTQLGRLAPDSDDFLLDNQREPAHAGVAMTIETIRGALSGPTTPRQHVAEWARTDFTQHFFYAVPRLMVP